MKTYLSRNRSSGLTLIELMTVMAILVVLMALVIPQLRMVTKDRAAREAARIVGSTLNDASLKARVDGFAGIAITRNGNTFRDIDAAAGTPEKIYYAGFQMFQLRQPPPYIGNEAGDFASIEAFFDGGPNGLLVDEMEVSIPIPLNPNILSDIVGFVKFNSTKTMFRILGEGPNNAAAPPGRLFLRCQIPPYLEDPPMYAGVPFEVVRRPELRQTSQVDLPRGYMINFNYSGPVDFIDSTSAPTTPPGWDAVDWTWTALSQNPSHQYIPPPPALPPPPLVGDEPVYIIFNEEGGINAIYPYGFSSDPIIMSGSLHLCITTDETKHSYQADALSDAMFASTPSDPLDDPSTMWISINHLNGSVVVTDNTPPQNTATAYNAADTSVVTAQKKAARLLEALTISGKRQSSRQ